MVLSPDHSDLLLCMNAIERKLSDPTTPHEALQWSELLCRATIDAIGDLIHVVDDDLRIRLHNKTLTKWCNALSLGEDALGRSLFEVFPFLPDRVRGEYVHVFETGETLVTEETATLFDNRITTESRKIPLLEHEKVVRVITVVRDITARKKVEEELRESEAKYRMLFESSRDAIMMIDGGKFFDCNEATLKIFGCSLKEEFIRKYPSELSPPTQPDGNDSHVAATVHIERALIQGSDFFEWMHKRIDGTLFPASVLLSRLTLGKRGLLQALVRDITERKRAEESLRLSEANYREIFNAANEAIFIHDRETGAILDVNCKMCDMFGYTREEARNLTVADISAAHAGYTHDEVLKWLRKAVHEGPQIFEWVHKDRAGRQFWAEVNLKQAVIGGKREILAVVRDIDDRKRGEEERRKLEAQLQHAQRMEAIGTLAGGIAHDFNNLLAGIQGNISLLLSHNDDTHPHHANLKSIEKLVQSGAKLTSQLLGYARKGKYEITLIDLNHLVQETSEIFGRTRKEITIHQEIAGDLCAIRGDQGQLEQVLFNLYVNAADAMPGGGDLTLITKNTTHQEMECKTYHPTQGNYAALTITDTGAGMDQDTMNHIFEPFFTTKAMGQGTGLGLASVYGIIKGHGGYIDVSSEEGKGTTFTLYLPATERKIQKTCKAPDQIIRGTGTVLLVDDEEMIRQIGKLLLEEIGYNVLVAPGGEEAIRICEGLKDRVDLVLLDMIMPGMSGRNTYNRLKEINPHIAVILSSGYSLEGQATEILESGCGGFIQKPFDTKQLSQKLSEVLGRKQGTLQVCETHAPVT